MSAAIQVPTRFNPVADNLAPAMIALGGQRVNGALETIKIAGSAVYNNLYGFVVLVSADFAMIHKTSNR